MSENGTIRAPARLESLELLRNFAAEQARRFGCSDQRVREVELAVEEALVNVFAYAYGEGEGEVSMACRELHGGTLEITVSDRGRAFDPAAFQPPAFDGTIAERHDGGMGILILKRYADAVAYERLGDRNILTISVTRKHADE